MGSIPILSTRESAGRRSQHRTVRPLVHRGDGRSMRRSSRRGARVRPRRLPRDRRTTRHHPQHHRDLGAPRPVPRTTLDGWRPPGMELARGPRRAHRERPDSSRARSVAPADQRRHKSGVGDHSAVDGMFVRRGRVAANVVAAIVSERADQAAKVPGCACSVADPHAGATRGATSPPDGRAARPARGMTLERAEVRACCPPRSASIVTWTLPSVQAGRALAVVDIVSP